MDVPLIDTDLKFFTVDSREYVLDIPSSSLFEVHPNLKRILEGSVHNLSTTYMDEVKREFHFIDWMEMVGELRYMIDNRHLTVYTSQISPYELKEQKVNSISLEVCHDCNMRCRYCFQGGGTFGQEPEYMTKEVALGAVEFLFQGCPDTRVFLNITGGEPLLNPDLVKFIVFQAREMEEKYEKEAVITLTTNGSLLDKELLNWLKIQRVELIIPLDGGTEEHNQMRLLANHRSSFELIRDRLEWVKDSEIDYRVKGIVHHLNLPDLQKIFQLFTEANYPVVSFEPVIAAAGEEYALSAEDIEIMKRHIAELFHKYREQDSFATRITNLNTAVRCITEQRNSGYTCGAGKNYLSITPNGDIYPCHLLVGNAQFFLGNILKGTMDQERRKQFYQPLHILNREGCQDCWARYFCGGGCIGENYLANKSLTEPYKVRCELARLGIEQAMEIYCSMLAAEEKLQFSPERRKSGREIYKIS